MIWLGLAIAAPPTHDTRYPEVPPPVPELPADAAPEVVRGANLYRTAGCVGCHSPPFREASHLGGGRDLPTIFGVFYAPNISPDPERGIGGWTEQDFERALRRGRAPDGHRYWPTFPYMAYTNLEDADVHALWAYLTSQPAVPDEPPEHRIRAPYRWPGLLGAWRRLGFHRGPLRPDPSLDEQEARGRYLVHAVGYCDQCHTPRGRTGFLQQRRLLAGGANPGKAEVHPNLTPDPEHGLGDWDEAEVAAFLATGDKPDGSTADPAQVMHEKITDSYAFFSAEDRAAIAAYLASLRPNPFDPARWAARFAEPAVRSGSDRRRPGRPPADRAVAPPPGG